MRQRPLAFDPIAEAERHWRDHGWEEAAPGMAAVTSIMRAQQILLGRVDDVLRAFDLTFARYELLRLLAFSRQGTLPLGKISQRLQVHAASVTNAVDRLVDQGLVTRTPNPSDGRGLLATITPAGQDVVDQATEKLNSSVFSSLGLSERDLQQLFRVLCKLRQSAGDF
jgi:DNA-binding MarR family transcriptional regulator